MAAIKMSSQGVRVVTGNNIGELSQLRILWGNCFEVKLQTKNACISNLVVLSNNYAVGLFSGFLSNFNLLKP